MALLQKIQTDYGTIRITRSAHDGSVTYYQNGCFHSQATRSGISICAYTHVMVEIIRQAQARHILIIGCAGGTLATMLQRQHCKVTVVDINPMAFAIARNYFNMPHDVRCIRRDGIKYIHTTRKTYDAVVIDAFGHNNSVPHVFTSKSFFQTIGNILSSSGLMMMNVMTSHDKDRRADDISLNAAASGMDMTLYDWPGQKDRNTILVGGDLRHTHIPSGKEPRWIKDDMRGLIHRKPKKRQFI